MLWALVCAGCSNDDAEQPVVTPEETGTFIDTRDSFEYHWVRIGGLDWITENSHYEIDDATKCCYYVDYDHYTETSPADNFSEKYGFLYTLQGAQEAVPEGWRLPTDADWKQLEMALGMSQTEADATGWRGSFAGALMKQANEGTMLGFQMAGYYTPYMGAAYPSCRYIGTYGYYWSATGDDSMDGEYYYFRKLYYNSSQVYRGSIEPDAEMLSVRFVRDAE